MIKKTLFCLALLSTSLMASFPVDFSVTTGYIWKNDHHYRKIFGRGIQDMVTLDLCYWFWCNYGIGLKGSYWEKEGHIRGLRGRVRHQEIPIILYLRGRKGDCFQPFWSLGGGFVAVDERRVLRKENHLVPALEGEVGINYYFCKKIFTTVALRYLYARQVRSRTRIDADYGGFGLRGGFGITF